MCPKCRSHFVGIRKATGIELIMIFLTNTRKYRCGICDHIFRAPDRRRSPR
jgi:hypothetical protein